jgi:hypothetical protein
VNLRGWRMYVGYGTKPRSVQNHPIQNMGAHILQIAIMGLTERGIQVCAPVHDAVLTECSLSEVDRHIAQVEEVMRIASKVALGMEIPVDTKKIVYPNRYMDNRGQKMFNLATEILSDIRLHDESESDSLSYSYSTTVPTPWDVPPGSYPLGATPPTTLGTLGEVWLCPRIISEIIISDI